MNKMYSKNFKKTVKINKRGYKVLQYCFNQLSHKKQCMLLLYIKLKFIQVRLSRGTILCNIAVITHKQMVDDDLQPFLCVR